MSSNSVVWDTLGKSSFNTHIKENEIDPRAADNILIAWPPVLKLIQSKFSPSNDVKILDYGCGTGGFCNKLNALGYSPIGVDSSEGMINTAKHNNPLNITYILGDHNSIQPLGKFNVVVSIMTLQFIEDLDGVLQAFRNSLLPGGIIVVADFNRDWVKESLKKHIWFDKFDSMDRPTRGLKTFKELNTLVFIRDSQDYDILTSKFGMVKILESNPPFTEEFIKKYPDYVPNSISEYLILGYQKE